MTAVLHARMAGSTGPNFPGPPLLHRAPMTAPPETDTSAIDRIDALLPQTQCTQCGYDGCRPYAAAIASGAADIDRCPPGGDPVIRRLAALLERTLRPLDRSRGEHKPRQVAVIDEAACIGCTLCIQACPVDAIAGAPKLMHTVVSFECTGCELCIPPCPVDCIVMQNAPWTLLDLATGERARAAAKARGRMRARTTRLERWKRENTERLAAKAQAKLASPELAADADAARKRSIVQAALARARARLAGMPE
jgi:electron transport complex protein RnfB